MDLDNLSFEMEELFEEALEQGLEDMEPLKAVVLPVRELVIFPDMVSPLHIDQEISLQAVELAQRDQLPFIALTQRDEEQESYPGPKDLYTVGTVVSLARTLHMPDGTLSVILQGNFRAQVTEYVQEGPVLIAEVEPLDDEGEENSLSEALTRAVLAMFEKVVQLNHTLPEEAYVYALNVTEPGTLANVIAQMLSLPSAQQQDLLETLNVVERLQKLSGHLARELDVLELETQIHDKVQRELDRSQREYFLREQLRAIQHELGETDAFTHDVIRIQERIEKAQLPDVVRQRAEEEMSRLAAMPPMSPEVGILRTYLDWLLNLPWSEATPDNLDLKHAQETLASRHYGLPKAKDRILEYIAVRKLAPEKSRSTILCFVGPPGTGKTSLGRSIAEALGRKFVRVSLGGIRDEAEIRGHRRTYIGALPGRILQTMRRAGTVNPVFMLDEVDKLGQDFRGDPASALLEVLDPEQNSAFSDHYLELPYDLSRVLFITTANVLYTIPPALLDRMEVIEFPGYTEEEKVEIARRFLLPRQLELNGLETHPLQFPSAALTKLIREYTYEAGVRNLERRIAGMCRKAARRLAEGKRPLRRVTPKMIERHLGPPRYLHDRLEQEDEIGVAMGLAWTANGGDLLPVEVALLPGKGNLTLTGQMGEVMRESVQAAFTYLRSVAESWKLDPQVFDKTDVHIHMPEGGIPKDGPSGGITLAVALVSAFTGSPVRHDVAMTGEITLRGRVLAVGGLKEKLLAAHRAGVKTVILPQRNEQDLPDIPANIRRKLDLRLVATMPEVLEIALRPPVKEQSSPEPDAPEDRG